MIKVYENGIDFIKENESFLKTKINLSSYFFIDAPLLVKTDKINYALLCSNDEHKLCALKVEPYNLMLCGDKECVNELIEFIINNDYEIKTILGEEEINILVINKLKEFNINYKEHIVMDLMEASEKTIPSDSRVEVAKMDDLDDIYEYMINFIKDCGLFDEIKKDKIQQVIDSYRLIRFNGKIASIARYAKSDDKYQKICYVYTPNEFRCMGFAKVVVNSIKNEMIDNGYIATLNVDRVNPISNHIYSSIGFVKTFSQSIIIKEEDNNYEI